VGVGSVIVLVYKPEKTVAAGSHSRRRQDSFRRSSSRRKDRSGCIDRDIVNNSEGRSIWGAAFMSCSAFMSHHSAPLFSSFNTSSSPLDIDCTIGLAHKAVQLGDDGGSYERCGMKARGRVLARLVGMAWSTRCGTSRCDCLRSNGKEFG
jgi:hypothetical protein